MFIRNRHTEWHMVSHRFLPILAFPLLVSAVSSAAAQAGVTAVLPNGREIHPAGNWIPLAPYPFALALRPDGAEIAAPSIGFPFAINVVDNLQDEHPAVRRMPEGSDSVPEIEVHAGLVYSPNGESLYVATGDSGKVRSYRTADWNVAGEGSLDGKIVDKEFSGSFATTNLPALTTGLKWDTTTLASSGIIKVAVTVNTNSPTLTNSVTGGVLTLTWPTDRIGWRLQVQTNTLAAGLGTNWQDVANSTTTNQVNVTIDAASATVFYRMVYP